MQKDNRLSDYANHFLKKGWFVVAIVVGSALNVINQYDVLLGEVDMNWPKLCLTYIVPYCVPSLSAWFQQ